MLNKIKLTGKVLPLKIKEKEEKRGLIVYLRLMVPNPNLSITILHCIVKGETAERLLQELQENDIAELWGYLRNERDKKPSSAPDKSTLDKKENHQILTKVIEFKRLDLTFNELEKQVKEEKINSNQVRLIGKVITDFKNPERKNPELLSFKVAVQREGNYFPLFFCRMQGELITDFNERVNKNDIILIEGFLQTVKNVEEVEEEGEIKQKIFSNSAIICRGFTLLDNDSARVFDPLDKIFHVVKDVKKIDFTKPKERGRTEE